MTNDWIEYWDEIIETKTTSYNIWRMIYHSQFYYVICFHDDCLKYDNDFFVAW